MYTESRLRTESTNVGSELRQHLQGHRANILLGNLDGLDKPAITEQLLKSFGDACREALAVDAHILIEALWCHTRDLYENHRSPDFCLQLGRIGEVAVANLPKPFLGEDDEHDSDRAPTFRSVRKSALFALILAWLYGPQEANPVHFFDAIRRLPAPVKLKTDEIRHSTSHFKVPERLLEALASLKSDPLFERDDADLQRCLCMGLVACDADFVANMLRSVGGLQSCPPEVFSVVEQFAAEVISHYWAALALAAALVEKLGVEGLAFAVTFERLEHRHIPLITVTMPYEDGSSEARLAREVISLNDAAKPIVQELLRDQTRLRDIRVLTAMAAPTRGQIGSGCAVPPAGARHHYTR